MGISAGYGSLWAKNPVNDHAKITGSISIYEVQYSYMLSNQTALDFSLGYGALVYTLYQADEENAPAIDCEVEMDGNYFLSCYFLFETVIQSTINRVEI